MLKKKLVVLGGTPNETTLVKRAQELGVYVIVADYYTDYKYSPAKLFANEAWDVDWKDVDKMTRLCCQHHVDGVTAGYSEVKIDYLIRICERLNLPCYCNRVQLEKTRDKKRFKDECRKCGVPVVREYDKPEDVAVFPVIVKPTDSAGSEGISIAHDKEELEKAYKFALDSSISGNVIIEDYITDQKIDIYYLVNDGKISVLTTNDVIMANGNGSERVVQSCWLYPHRYEKNLIEKEDKNLRRMIEDMGIRYGCIFFSGFIDKNYNYKFFECGFRLEGAHQYNYTALRGPVNFLDVFIWHAIDGNIQKCRMKNVEEELHLAIINIYAKEGIIGKISGAEKVNNYPDCVLSLIKANEGDICQDDTAILHKVGMFEFANVDAKMLAKDIENAYRDFSVNSVDGEDLIYDRIDTERISTWWN